MSRSIEELTSWARTHIRWFGQSAIRISTASGVAIFIDPWRVPAAAGPANLILITHPHGDHYDQRAVAGISGSDTTVVMPASAAQGPQKGMRAGQTEKLGSVSVTAVPAYNISRRFHPRSREWIGYLIETDGMRIYHAGDTDLIPEMAGLRPDIALLPIGGMLTMDWRTAAQAARSLGAGLSIPMHFNMLIGGRKAGEKFARAAGPGSLVLTKG